MKENEEIQQKKLEAAKNTASVPDHSERIKEILEELEEEEELKIQDAISLLKDEEDSLEFHQNKNKSKGN
jgi:uncharacterized membrane protein